MSKSLKKLKEFRKWFNKYIEKGYGKPCKNFCWNCANCHAQFVKDVFDDFVDDTIITEKWFKEDGRKGKRKQKNKMKRKYG